MRIHTEALQLVAIPKCGVRNAALGWKALRFNVNMQTANGLELIE